MRVVLAHELAHIKRCDWGIQILAEIARIVYWFNPLIWIGCNRLRAESELAADDAVLRLGIRPLSYAEQLLAMARSLTHSGQAWLPALAVARQANLERRLIAMLNPSLDRRTVNAKTAVLTIAAALCLVLPLAAWQTLSGKFFGTVYDPSGGVIRNATVIITNPESGTRDMTTSDAAGRFEFPTLPSGRYTLEVLSPGFAAFRKTNLLLEPNKTQHQDITLDLGRISERIDVVAQSPANAVSPRAPQGEAQRIRVGGNVQRTKIINMVRPVYPPVAKATGIQGSVLLEGVISKEGNVLSLRVKNTEIDPDLARAAVEAVSQWRYQPTWLNGNPVEVIVDITVNFTLQH
jgi:TonB family protein